MQACECCLVSGVECGIIFIFPINLFIYLLVVNGVLKEVKFY